MRRTLEGDATAFASLVRRHRRAALARALAIVGDTFDAEDVAQDAFVQAYEQLSTLRDHSRFEPWVLTIVYRRSLNALRSERRRRAAPLTDAIPDASHAPAEPTSRERPSRAALLAAIATLSPAQRTVLLLADLEGWPHERIARTIPCSAAMSRRNLSDARRRLRETLSGEEGA